MKMSKTKRSKLYILIKHGSGIIELLPFEEWARRVKPDTVRKKLERADLVLYKIHDIRRGRRGRRRRLY